jgi:uncharacterized alpha/beta hydrolase family protein
VAKQGELMNKNRLKKAAAITVVILSLIIFVTFHAIQEQKSLALHANKKHLNDGEHGWFVLNYGKVPGVIGTGYTKKIIKDNRKVVPTLFIHGLNGSGDTFNGVFNGHWIPGEDLNKDIEFTDIVTVGSVQGNDDSLRVSLWTSFEESQITAKTSENPFVQIIFPLNQHTFKQQVMWLKRAIKELQTEYNFDTINIVGHSMGGVIGTKYIEDTYGSEEFPRVDKLITLDSPINGSAVAKRFKYIFTSNKELSIGSKAIKQLYENKEMFDPRTQVVSYAALLPDGVLGDIVSTESALALRGIAQGPVTIVTTPYSHTGKTGIINPEIMNDVAKYLWGESEIKNQEVTFP